MPSDEQTLSTDPGAFTSTISSNTRTDADESDADEGVPLRLDDDSGLCVETERKYSSHDLWLFPNCKLFSRLSQTSDPFRDGARSLPNDQRPDRR